MNTDEFCAEAGITRRQSGYWDERGLLRAARPDGRNREYDEDDIPVARLLSELTRHGFKFRNCKRLLQTVVEVKGRYLLILGGKKRIFRICDGTQTVKTAAAHAGPVLALIDLDELRR